MADNASAAFSVVKGRRAFRIGFGRPLRQEVRDFLRAEKSCIQADYFREEQA